MGKLNPNQQQALLDLASLQPHQVILAPFDEKIYTCLNTIVNANLSVNQIFVQTIEMYALKKPYNYMNLDFKVDLFNKLSVCIKYARTYYARLARTKRSYINEMVKPYWEPLFDEGIIEIYLDKNDIFEYPIGKEENAIQIGSMKADELVNIIENYLSDSYSFECYFSNIKYQKCYKYIKKATPQMMRSLKAI